MVHVVGGRFKDFTKSVQGELLAAAGRQREGDQPLHMQPRSFGFRGEAGRALWRVWHHPHEARVV